MNANASNHSEYRTFHTAIPSDSLHFGQLQFLSSSTFEYAMEAKFAITNASSKLKYGICDTCRFSSLGSVLLNAKTGFCLQSINLLTLANSQHDYNAQE